MKLKTSKLSDAEAKAARAAYQREWFLNRQKMCIAYLGGKCVVCGTRIGVEVHHRDPSQKSFNPAHDRRAWLTTIAELDKCELRCVEHHKEAHATTHGQLRMYKFYKCRCEACTAAWREWSRAYQKSDKYKAWARANKKKKYWKNREEFLAKQRAYRRSRSGVEPRLEM